MNTENKFFTAIPGNIELNEFCLREVEKAQQLCDELNGLNGKYKFEIMYRFYQHENGTLEFNDVNVCPIIDGSKYQFFIKKDFKGYYTTYSFKYWEFQRTEYFDVHDMQSINDEIPMNVIKTPTAKKIDALIDREIKIYDRVVSLWAERSEKAAAYRRKLADLFGANNVKWHRGGHMEGHVSKNGFTMEFNIYKSGNTSETITIQNNTGLDRFLELVK